MNFNTIEFLFIFLPLSMVAFYYFPAKYRLYILLFFSLSFYGYSGLLPLSLMVLSIIWAAFFVIINKYRKSLFLLIISISFPFLVLVLFKYSNFILHLIDETGRLSGQEYISTSVTDFLEDNAQFIHIVEPVFFLHEEYKT